MTTEKTIQILRRQIAVKQDQVKSIIAGLIMVGYSIKEISAMTNTPGSTVRAIRKQIIDSEIKGDDNVNK